MNITMITAHAGAEDTPANTMESVRELLDCGADAVEVDVRRHEGRLVLSHNPVADGQCLAALEDGLAALSEHAGMRMNLDLKHTGLVEEVARMAQRLGVTDRLILTGDVGEEDLPAVRAHGLTVWYNDSLLPAGIDPVQGAKARGFQAANLCYRDVTEALLADPESLSLWTVDDAATLARLLGRGVRGITTRHPRLALRIRDMILNFHRGWDAFPGSARLVDREGIVLAANDAARRAGFVEGIACRQVETANRHRGCLLARAFKTGQGQFDVSETGLLRAWVPTVEWDGAMIHLSFKRS